MDELEYKKRIEQSTQTWAQYIQSLDYEKKLFTNDNIFKDLIKLGYKIIRIRSNRLIPTQKQIKRAVNTIISGKNKISITLKDWGSGPTIYDRSKKLQSQSSERKEKT